MIRTAFQGMHPALRFIFFFCMIFAGMGVAVFAAAGSYCVLYDIALTDVFAAMTTPGIDDRLFLFWMNDLNQLIGFGGPALAYYALFGRHGIRSETSARPGIKWLALAAVGTLAASPLIDLAYRLNRWAIEQTVWNSFVAELEQGAAAMTELMLTTDGAWDVALLLLSIAVIPAICEELAFRGVLQPLIARWSGNVHVGIWVTALLFSAIHMQFYGFSARVLLGAGLGYLVIHSGRLWVGMLAHGINNAAVVGFMLLWPEYINAEVFLQDMTVSDWLMVGASVGAIAAIIYAISRASQWPHWRADYTRPA